MIAALAVVAVAAVAALLYALKAQQETFREAQAQWALERRELLTRIQRPELPMPNLVGGFEMPEQEQDDWNKVGTIVNDPELYLKADEPEAG